VSVYVPLDTQMVDETGAASSAAWISPPGSTVAAQVTAAWLAVAGMNIRVTSESEATKTRPIEARRTGKPFSWGLVDALAWYVPREQGCYCPTG
jgi:hypothetical protein